MSNLQAAGVSVAFVDLATFDELAAFLYGGVEALSYFVMAVKKSNWFSQLPAILRICSGTADFGSEFSASLNRSGDYITALHIQAQVPQLTLVNTVHTDAAIRFCKNFMHNLISRVTLTFNELCVQELDSAWFDLIRQFQIPQSKQAGYDNMIANIASYNGWSVPGAIIGANAAFQGAALGDGALHALVIPFWFFQDSGVALMVAGLPFNDIKVNFTTRPIAELVLLDPGTTGGAAATYTDLREATISSTATTNPVSAGSATIRLRNVEVFATYNVVHNDERVKIGKAPRDVLIQQVQRVQNSALDASADAAQTTVDLRLSHQIIALFWLARCNYHAASHSEYSTVPWPGNNGIGGTGTGTLTDTGVDPIVSSALLYENTVRVNQDSSYYTSLDPYYFSERIPDETGYHMKSYSLRTFEYQPKGSTGFSKLANVSMVHTASTGAFIANTTGRARNACVAENAFSTADIKTSPNSEEVALVSSTATQIGTAPAFRYGPAYTLFHRGLNWNIGRMAGGSFGLPVL